MEIKEITELILQQTWHWNFVDPRCYNWDLYCTYAVAMLRQDYEFMSPSPPFSSLCIGRTENVRWLAGGSLARTTQGYSSWPSHNWRKYADLWDLCWHLGLAGGRKSYEREERDWERSILTEGGGWCLASEDCSDGSDVLQTPLTSSPLISSRLDTLSIHLNLSGTEGRERRKYSNYTWDHVWWSDHTTHPHHPPPCWRSWLSRLSTGFWVWPARKHPTEAPPLNCYAGFLLGWVRSLNRENVNCFQLGIFIRTPVRGMSYNS